MFLRGTTFNGLAVGNGGGTAAGGGVCPNVAPASEKRTIPVKYQLGFQNWEVFIKLIRRAK